MNNNQVTDASLLQLEEDEPAVSRELRFFLNSEKEIEKTIADFKGRKETKLFLIPCFYRLKVWGKRRCKDFYLIIAI